jgi:hypothetical protein
MYGEMIFIEDGKASKPLLRMRVHETVGRDEAWLRDTLFANPGILPISSIDPSFGPLIPLCKEFPIGRGRVDLAFINRDGFLTLV